MAAGVSVEIKFKRGDITRAARKFGISRKDFDAIMRNKGLKFVDRVLQQSDALVPVKFGNLKATGGTLGPKRIPGGTQVQIKYGGNAARKKSLPKPSVLGPDKVDYALLQHETHARQRGFMVNPFLADRNRYFKEIAAGIRNFYTKKKRGK